MPARWLASPSASRDGHGALLVPRKPVGPLRTDRMGDMEHPCVCAVVVTWNRRELLIQSLDAVFAQEPAPQTVIVVDNASTDGSADLVSERYPGVYLVRSATNTGGAGGFALGLATALEKGCEAIWLMDDDTVPTSGALAALLAARAAYQHIRGGQPALVGSRVIWVDGRDHPMNTPRPNPFASRGERTAAREIGCIPIRTASFVSILLDAARVRDVGLPIADYFLWNDDFEFTARLLRDSPGLICPGSVVVHKTKTFGGSDADPGERFIFEVRNKLWTFTRSRALTPLERILYAGSTGRRWLGTLARSADRRVLLRGLAAGVRLGVRPPRRTEDVLADAKPTPAPAGLVNGVAAAAGILPEPFSVLLPVYAGDDPEAFDEALRSVTAEQILKPSEVVIVRDGPLPPALASRIDRASGRPGGLQDEEAPIRVIELRDNVGLGRALAAGLVACTHDVVARQDADDISCPGRFAAQVPLLSEGWDLVGSALVEFDGSTGVLGLERVPPLRPAGIRDDARFAQPVFHPTLVYRRSVVEAAGGYQDLPLLEDYWLIARMILMGARITNVREPLVRYRVSAGAYGRRGGTALLWSELRLQWRFLRCGFTSPGQFARNVAVRGAYRLLPEGLRRAAYRRFRAQRGHR